MKILKYCHNHYIIVLAVLIFSYSASSNIFAYEEPYGNPQEGIQASITVERNQIPLGTHPVLQLTLTNVSDQTIQVDTWQGHWYLEIFHADTWEIIKPYTKAVDILRPFPELLALEPGEKWHTEINNLALITGLKGSTPIWEYKKLGAGKYFIGAWYSTVTNTDEEEFWYGNVSCKLIELQVMK